MPKMTKEIDDLLGVDPSNSKDGVFIEPVTKKPTNKPAAINIKHTILGKKLLNVATLGLIVAGVIQGGAYYQEKQWEENNNSAHNAILKWQAELPEDLRTQVQEELAEAQKDRKNVRVERSAFGKTRLVEITEDKKIVPLNDISDITKKSPTSASPKPTPTEEVKKEPKIKTNYIKDKNILLEIERVSSKVKVPNDFKNNQVGIHMVKELVKDPEFKKDFNAILLATTLYREGFVSHVYNDVGYASIGPGQTMGVQSPKSTEDKYSSIGLPEETVKFFKGLSGKKLETVQLPSDYKKITITGEQGAQLALLQIHKDFITAVKNTLGEKVYNAILPQQQVALVGLAYQKGNIGHTTGNAVKQHVSWLKKNPNASEEQQIKNWSSTVTPTYSMTIRTKDKNGNLKEYQDTHSLMFAQMISDRFDLAMKQMSNTITPKEHKEFSAVVKQVNKAIQKSEQELIKVDMFGNTQLLNPLKELKEKANNGEIQLSIDKPDTEPKQKKAPVKKGLIYLS